MLNISPAFQAAEKCPYKAMLADAREMFTSFFEQNNIETRISIVDNTVKAYPVLFIEPAGKTGFHDLGEFFYQHRDSCGQKHFVTLQDIVVTVDEGPRPGFFMMAGMSIVEDMARSLNTTALQGPAIPAGAAMPSLTAK